MYIKDKTRIKPIIYGGGQQKGMRSGTENVPAIAGLSAAVKLIYNEILMLRLTSCMNSKIILYLSLNS